MYVCMYVCFYVYIHACMYAAGVQPIFCFVLLYYILDIAGDELSPPGCTSLSRA